MTVVDLFASVASTSPVCHSCTRTCKYYDYSAFLGQWCHEKMKTSPLDSNPTEVAVLKAGSNSGSSETNDTTFCNVQWMVTSTVNLPPDMFMTQRKRNMCQKPAMANQDL